MTEEQIFGTLQVLTEADLPCYLPYHENGGFLIPFVWNVAEQGEFNILNLSREKGWLRITDFDAIVNSWQEMEYLQSFPGFSLDSAEKASRKGSFSDLFQLLSTYSHDCAAFILTGGEYLPSPGIVVGQTRDNDWICISPTVYKPTEIPNELISRYPLPAPTPLKPLGENTLDLQTRIQSITSKLGSIHIAREEGGYYFNHDHRFIHSASDMKESAITKALQASGTLEIHQFNGFYTDQTYLNDWFDGDVVQIYSRYEQINQFLKQHLSNLIFYRCSFWTQEHIYVIGQTQLGNWIGLYLESEFVYNP